MTLSKTLLALALVTTATLPARADSWSRSQMTAAASYLPETGITMIVGVGASAQPAASTLLEALQGSSIELAIDAHALGRVDDKSDEQIVKLAFARPIKRVAIVRVFPSGGATKAVVTVYAAQGQVATAFTLVPGRNLVENPNPRAASDGVARDELQSVSGATGGERGAEGDVTYQRQKIVGVTTYGVVTFDNVTFEKDGHPISDVPDLYEALDMRAEATRYRDLSVRRNKWLPRGVLLGTVGMVGFITFGTLALATPSTKYDYATGVETHQDHSTLWALTGATAGAVALGVYLVVAHPAPRGLSADEAIALVDKRNAKKKQATASLRFAPVVTPAGGGFVLGGQF